MNSLVILVKSTTHKQRYNLWRALGYSPKTHRIPHTVINVHGEIRWDKDGVYHEIPIVDLQKALSVRGVREVKRVPVELKRKLDWKE